MFQIGHLLYGTRALISSIPLPFTAPLAVSAHPAKNETRLDMIKMCVLDLITYKPRRDEKGIKCLQKLFEAENSLPQTASPSAPLAVYAVTVSGYDNGAMWSGPVRGWHLKRIKALKQRGLIVMAFCIEDENDLKTLTENAQAQWGRPVALLDALGHGESPFDPIHLPALAPGAHIVLEACEAGIKGGLAQPLAEQNPTATVWASQELLAYSKPIFNVRGGRVDVRGVLCMTGPLSWLWGAQMRPYEASERP